MGELDRRVMDELGRSLSGTLHTDRSYQVMYATDGSAYKEMPLAVVVPENRADIERTIAFARENGVSVIPRGAGTSLAGQVVGSGIVIDLTKHFCEIIELNREEKWVRVQPGVILNQLNAYLEPHGLFFAPEAATASRCTIGGMLGNNSCGLHSVIYGSTREHVLSVKAILSDGSEAVFAALDSVEYEEKGKGEALENRIYRRINDILSDPENQQEIQTCFPDPTLPRRNTGYALDVLLENRQFSSGEQPFNLCKLLAGSEGTLAFATEIKLNLIPLPPQEKGILCAHFETLEEALEANLIALSHRPGAVELMDGQIVKLTEGNILQRKNRFFIKGEPGAVLMIEFARESREEIQELAEKVEEDMRAAGLGYHYPLVFGQEDISRVWALRKSALGLLSNLPGDAKPVSVIEDTAVHPQVLPAYIAEFKEILNKYGLSCVFHAHVGSGEIHIRPVLNLKQGRDVDLFREIAADTARLVKKYNGSLSGEHGDGRLRGEFIPLIIGEKNYNLLKEIKQVWDPGNIFNPGKIVDTPRMNTQLRYVTDKPTKEFDTVLDFTASHGYIRAIEKCNGSGDCKATSITGKGMCPSYQATLDESMTTRARANLLREFLNDSEKMNPFDYQELNDILDQCLSCKSCKSECPSNVDMARLKAEFLQHYHDAHRLSVRNLLIANITLLYRIGSLVPSLFNFINRNRFTGGLIKKMSGFVKEREMPSLYRVTLKSWAGKNLAALNQSIEQPVKTVYLFNDELSNFNDVEIGIKTIQLLVKLNYEVILTDFMDSGRALISKGFLRKAQRIATRNVKLLQDRVSATSPILGLDPSTILGFRDEYADLVEPSLKEAALSLAEGAFMVDEFLAAEMAVGNISVESFTREQKQIRFHGHCHQKSLASTQPTADILSFPENYTAEEIDSGCCGMAGSFGFEKEHYKLSLKVGEMKLLPEVRKTDPSILISATGASCRQQIRDNTGREAPHPVEILFDALI
ncbi:MAG: FAD-binding protein [Deltaproteobacteria bacterium]|nr:FAD-binding protein [Deltaproteobacteria bacterium]MBT4642289.1 FAD-binding protein [Deltaproteobacteria bacterium]MBT7152068.1 FAD-binding protein [Deltaproteobacteria bacterium]MBT7713231.1 FAD-binding protein [Deltaproteobacteria bacterium]